MADRKQIDALIEQAKKAVTNYEIELVFGRIRHELDLDPEGQFQALVRHALPQRETFYKLGLYQLAAQELVPDWLSMSACWNYGSRHKPSVLCWSHDDPHMQPARYAPPRVWHEHLCLAILIAALSARLAMMETDDG